MFKQTQTESAAAPAPGRGSDHADKLSGIRPLVHDARETLPPQPPAPRIAMRWYFTAALVLCALAAFVLPTPFSGIAALASVGTFVTGGVRRINQGDPEMVSRTTSSGIIGGGG